MLNLACWKCGKNAPCRRVRDGRTVKTGAYICTGGCWSDNELAILLFPKGGA